MVIALIDKYPIIRIGLEKALHLHFEGIITMESESITLIHELYPEFAPDVIVIGINQRQQGYNMDHLRMSKKWYPKGRIIVYDEQVNPPMIPQYLSMGVSGYLSKATDLAELISCVRNVLSGKKYFNGIDFVHVLNTYESEEKYTWSSSVRWRIRIA